ncbi:hypothetical protein KY290_002636 [Solanum tuberosum]|uniref:Uncharacterized protein n=1 Tax=Solanum tuberosum TaxID=4113 RepID=A0ABQ7WQN1_SOLTU|nr:hypothetical protein KY290_002636 [Solanum tuberosum]
MKVNLLDVEMEFHMENQHEHDNINTIEASDEWTTWRDELAQLKWLVLLLQHLTRPERRQENQHLHLEGWRGDNGTFMHVYLMELEHYMNARHPNCGLKSLPHVDSKMRVDPNAKSMNLKKWPLFVDREEIFGKDKATGEFAEEPEDVVEEIERIEAQEITNGTSVGFSIDVVDVDDVSGTREDKAAQEDLMYQLEQHKVHLLLKMNLMNQLEQHKVHSQLKKVKPINLRNKVMKQFTESHDKKMASLIDKLGERDLSEIRGKIFSIIGSPAFEIYNSNEQVKAAMGITQDIKRMEFFLSISELERHSMIWMIINDKL